MQKHIFLIIALFVGMAWGQSEPQLPELPNGVTLPPQLEGVDLDKIQNKSLIEFQERCLKNGGPGAFEKAQNASIDLGNCIKNLVDPAELQNEIEEAKPHGNVDEVFKKYCAKKPLFEGCLKNFTETSKVCLATAEQKHLKTVYNVSEQLAEFICFKEGDRIALFISEGGQECFQEKQEGITQCFNETGLGGAVDPKTINTITDLDTSAISNFSLSFDEKQCKQLSQLQNCVVKVLEGCAKPTSANIVESLFKFIRKATPCKNFAEVPNSSASSLIVAVATLVMAATAAILI